MARENCIHDLRHHGVFVSDDAGKDGGVVVLAQAGDEVIAEFVFHAAGAQTFLGKWTAAQFAERAWKTHEEPPGKYFSGLYAVGASAFCSIWKALVNMAVASGLFAGTCGAMKIGNDGFEIGDE